MKEYTKNGMYYTWELAGSQGAAFILYPEPKHTAEDIKKAKEELRDSQDVVSLRVASEDDRDYEYKGEIFSHPATRPLKWYQINAEDKLLRQERLKNTSAEDFVNKFVLPFIAETEQRLLEKYGKEIYSF